MKRVFEKVKPDSRIIIGYGASLFLLLLVYVVTLIANDRLKKRTAWMEHTYKVMFELESLISKMKDAETGVRGYYITRDIDFLEPYNNSEKAMDSIHNNLVILTGDNTLQQERLSELQAAYKERFRIFNEFLSYTKNGTTDTAYKQKPAQDAAKRVMDKIRRMVSFMQAEENKLLSQREQMLKTTFSTINTITITSLLLTLVLVIIGFVTYTGENKARKLALHRIKEYQHELNKRIDELNTANAQLIKMRSMEKFAATGRIARTIAHEVRNPLTNIDLATSQLKTETQAPDENTAYFFDVIERNSKRINKLISDLLQTTKFSELNFTNIAASNLIDETLLLAKDRIDLNQVQLEKNFRHTQDIKVDVEKMKIALLNIIINAIEAMKPGEGVLKISTRKENNNCVIEITDNGAGMDETELSKLFEPYFTSKPNGNGLGLANTQNIIFNHKGSISVSSQPGKGSVFTIFLEAI